MLMRQISLKFEPTYLGNSFGNQHYSEKKMAFVHLEHVAFEKMLESLDLEEHAQLGELKND